MSILTSSTSGQAAGPYGDPVLDQAAQAAAGGNVPIPQQQSGSLQEQFDAAIMAELEQWYLYWALKRQENEDAAQDPEAWIQSRRLFGDAEPAAAQPAAPAAGPTSVAPASGSGLAAGVGATPGGFSPISPVTQGLLGGDTAPGGQAGAAGISGQLPDGSPVINGEVSPDGQVANAESAFEGQYENLRELAKQYYDKDNPSNAEMMELWRMGVDQMGVALQMGQNKKDPWHWIRQIIDDKTAEEESIQQEFQRVQRTINITDPTTAQALVRAMFTQSLGRAPSEQEIGDFVSALTGYEEENPSITTAQYEYDEQTGQHVQTESRTEGGADPSAFGDEWLDEEFGEEMDIQRVGTEFFNVAQQLVGGIA